MSKSPCIVSSYDALLIRYFTVSIVEKTQAPFLLMFFLLVFLMFFLLVFLMVFLRVFIFLFDQFLLFLMMSNSAPVLMLESMRR